MTLALSTFANATELSRLGRFEVGVINKSANNVLYFLVCRVVDSRALQKQAIKWFQVIESTAIVPVIFQALFG